MSPVTLVVQQGAKGSFVWVIDAENKAEFRPIEVGSWHGDDWFVEKGLVDGETVAVGGALKLRAGVPVQITRPGADPSEKTAEPSGTDRP